MDRSLEYKTVRAAFKADDETPGVFSAIVSVFGNVDRGGDRVLKGAFSRSLKERGLPPVLWSHDFDNPPIGKTISAEETDEGLLVKVQLFLDAGERPRLVNEALKADALEFSFAYETIDAADVVEDGKSIRDLKDLDLWEVSPVIVGMNPATRLVEPPKVGARNSGGDLDRLQEIHDLSVENGAKCATDADGKTSGASHETKDDGEPSSTDEGEREARPTSPRAIEISLDARTLPPSQGD